MLIYVINMIKASRPIFLISQGYYENHMKNQNTLKIYIMIT